MIDCVYYSKKRIYTIKKAGNYPAFYYSATIPSNILDACSSLELYLHII